MAKYKYRGMDYLFYAIVYIVVIVATVITIYPFIYTISMSVSNPIAVSRNEIFFLPKGFSLDSYKMIFRDSEIWRSYSNTIWYTVVGTLLNLAMTLTAAYPLSRKRFFLRRGLMIFVTITMFFSGGMIPSFILVQQLGIYNTRWAIILPVAISSWNLIICRNFFEGIPDSIEEAAQIDGASHFRILISIFLPLCMPIIAVLTLFYAVSHWNSYFSALLYLIKDTLQPMQIYLRKVLVLSNTAGIGGAAIGGGQERSMATIQLKYSVIIVSILPILFVYPFLQKYFVKGVMVGAVKG